MQDCHAQRDGAGVLRHGPRENPPVFSCTALGQEHAAERLRRQ